MAERKKPTRKKPEATPGIPWTERLDAQMLVLALLVLVAYWKSLGAAFQWDDTWMVVDPGVTNPGFGWGVFRLSQTRPLTFLTFHWNYALEGANPGGFHWVNLLLHCGNVVLLLLIARRHLPALAPIGIGAGPAAVAFLGAGIFAVHPLGTEAVTYIFSRSTLLATFLALLAFLLFLEDRLAWSVVAFAFSLLAKEETIALPGFLLLYDLALRRRRLIVGYYAGLGGVAGLAAAHFFYLLRVVPGSNAGFHVRGLSVRVFALTEARVVWKYLKLFVLPTGLNADHDVELSRGLLSPPTTLLAVLGLALVVGLLAWFAGQGSQAAVWGLGFFVLITPTSTIVPLGDVMAEHRIYFPIACLALAAAWLLGRLPRRTMGVVGSAILAILLVGTVVRNRVWQDPASLWADALEKSPRKARPYVYLARIYWEQDAPRSGRLLEAGLAMHPDDGDLHNEYGLWLLDRGNPQAALQRFQRAIQLAGENINNLTNLAGAQHALGLREQAVAGFRRALAIWPCDFGVRLSLVSVLWESGKRQEALQSSELPAGCRYSVEDVQEMERYHQFVATHESSSSPQESPVPIPSHSQPSSTR